MLLVLDQLLNKGVLHQLQHRDQNDYYHHVADQNILIILFHVLLVIKANLLGLLWQLGDGQLVSNEKLDCLEVLTLRQIIFNLVQVRSELVQVLEEIHLIEISLGLVKVLIATDVYAELI